MGAILVRKCKYCERALRFEDRCFHENAHERCCLANEGTTLDDD